jgi:sec-independent protein translocase protein TatC
LPAGEKAYNARVSYYRVMSDDARREPDEQEEGTDADGGDGREPSSDGRDRDDVEADATGGSSDEDSTNDPPEEGAPTSNGSTVEDSKEGVDDVAENASAVGGSLPDWVEDDTAPPTESYGGDPDPDAADRTADGREDEGEDNDGSGDDRDDELDPALADQGVDWDAVDTGDDDTTTTDTTTTDADADVVPQSDGGSTVSGSGAGSVGGEFPDEFDDDDLGGLEGPQSDQEMPLADHIEEMVRRLGVVIVAMAIVSVLVLPISVDLINFIWYSILGNVQDVPNAPHVYQPLALVLARLKVATLAGFVVALPVFIFETYLFMRPGLYEHERRYYLAAVPTSLVLAIIGVAFAFFLVLPALFSYFVSYTTGAAAIAFGLTDTFGLMLLMMGFFAAVFQIPLLIMLAVMMGLTTRQWLADRRLYFWGGFLGVALLFSPDPTGMAPIIVALTMVVLFEGTLLLLRWTDR